MNDSGPGHIYVLELTGGVIKVGYSRTVESRLRQHTYKLRQDDVEILRRWTSPRHTEAAVNEQALKATCTRLGGQHHGPPRAEEWFTGIRFDDVVAEAESLPFTAYEGAPIMTGGEARGEFRRMLNKVESGQSIGITRYGKRLAAVVPAGWFDLAQAALEKAADAPLVTETPQEQKP